MPTIRQAQEFLAQYRADELAHHGVLGQKWGVRHDTPSAPRAVAKPKTVKVSKTQDTKISKGDLVVLGILGAPAVYVGGVAAAVGAQSAYGTATAPLHKKVVTEDVSKILKSTDLIDQTKDFLNAKSNTDVPEGTSFHRVASRVESSIDAPKYATYLPNDVLHYRNSWITPTRTTFNEHHLTTMTATRDVRIASPHSILETIAKDMDTRLSDGSSLYSRFARVAGYNGDIPASPEFKKALAQQIVNHNRNNIWGDDIGEATSHLMKKAGYAAVTDINNTGSQSRRHAVIVLDDAAFTVESRKLTQGERAAARIANRKLGPVENSAAAKQAIVDARNVRWRRTIQDATKRTLLKEARSNAAKKVGTIAIEAAKSTL